MADVVGVLLTGTIGVGKTTLAEAISERLHEAELRHALLDLDWLGQVYPPPDAGDPFNDSLAVRNLEVIWPNFVDAGIRYAILAATVLDEEQLDRIRSALNGCDLTAVRVSAPPDLVAARIRRRNVGNLLDDFLRRTDSVAVEIEQAGLDDFSVTNDERLPADVAGEILDELGWLP